MNKIIWKNEFSVGVNRLDEQHKKLITMVNTLIDQHTNMTEPKVISDLLTEMTDYAQVHFREEEFLMAEYGYEHKTSQEQQHQAFIDKTISFYSASDIGPNILSEALLNYLQSWLIQHILKEDMKYKQFFMSKGIN